MLIGVILVIIILLLAYRHINRDIAIVDCAEEKLNQCIASADSLQDQLEKQQAELDKCGSKVACNRVQSTIDSMRADLASAHEQLDNTLEELAFHKKLNLEMRGVLLNRSDYGYDVVSAEPAFSSPSKLLTRIELQEHLIRQLQTELQDRNARIAALRRQFLGAVHGF